VTTAAQAHPPDPDELEDIAVALAEGAAQVVRDARGDAVEVTAKSTVTDLVTEIDRRTERWLVAEIARRRPGDAVLGEEGGDHPGSTGVRWVLDPIDGTVNFVLGLPQYAVSVAAEVDGVVVAGAVCNPVTGETFRAHLGGGAHLGDQRLTGPRDVPLPRAVIGTGFSYDAGWRARQIAVVAPLVPRVADLRRLGASSLDVCFVAAGRLDGYFEAGLNVWDYAAGALVATEAGCVVTGLHRRPPSKRMLAVTGSSMADELFGELEALGADTVTDVSK
jgi:myo-inositol-1(or 4)-monophosphatase